MTNKNKIARWTLACLTTTALCGTPLAMVACDQEVSKNKTTTQKTTETPSGTKTTTESTETKVETQKKP
jgi:hypothetical protein